MSRFDITQAFQQAARPAAPAERTIEAITGDILEAQRKGGEAILTIGNCLIEAKSMLLHGEWLPWLNSKVGYSEKTAQNFMRLAREFSNPQALADLGAAREEADLASSRARALEEKLRMLQEKPVDVAVETVVDQDAIAKAQKEARAQAVAEMQAELDRAKEARDKADDKRRQAEASVETLKRSLEERAKTEKKAVLGADKDLAQFELLFQQAQETANKMHGILLKVRSRDEDAAGRLVKALQALAEAVGRCAE